MRDALVKIVVVFARYRYAMLCYVICRGGKFNDGRF